MALYNLVIIGSGNSLFHAPTWTSANLLSTESPETNLSAMGI